MTRKVILEVVVGSTVHGTSVPDGLEDLDIMAVELEGIRDFAGFNTSDTWINRTKPTGVRSEAGDVDHVAYGLRKFLNLALKGNPSILVALFVPDTHVHVCTKEGQQLQSLAPYIVSKQVYMPFRGYMRQQHERLLGLRGQRNITRPELVEAYGYDTKYAAHVVRLGLQGQELLRTGRITLPMPVQERELVLKIRTGRFSLAEVSEKIIGAERQLDVAYTESSLNAHPNQQHVEHWMLDAYRNHWNNENTTR